MTDSPATALRPRDTHAYILIGLVGVLVLVAALGARGGGASWVSVYQPEGLRLVEGHTVEYESSYFSTLPRAMLGGPPPSAITTAHYRMLLTQVVSSAILRWTGSEYWALALTDLGGATLGVVGVVWLGRLLGFGIPAIALAVFAYATSPVVVGFMWRNQLHVQAVGSAALACAASVAALGNGFANVGPPRRGRWREVIVRGVALAAVWLTASWQYQFHLVIAPSLLGYIMLSRAQWRGRLVIWAVALITFVGMTAGAFAALAAVGLPVIAENNDPRFALQDLADLARVGRVPELFELAARPFARIADTYHPVMAVLALVGILVMPRGAKALFISLTALLVVSLLARDLDRVAHALSPAIYLSAACGVVALPQRIRAALGTSSLSRVAEPAARILLAAALSWVVLHTNADVWGDYTMFHQIGARPLFPR